MKVIRLALRLSPLTEKNIFNSENKYVNFSFKAFLNVSIFWKLNVSLWDSQFLCNQVFDKNFKFGIFPDCQYSLKMIDAREKQSIIITLDDVF